MTWNQRQGLSPYVSCAMYKVDRLVFLFDTNHSNNDAMVELSRCHLSPIAGLQDSHGALTGPCFFLFRDLFERDDGRPLVQWLVVCHNSHRASSSVHAQRPHWVETETLLPKPTPTPVCMHCSSISVETMEVCVAQER